MSLSSNRKTTSILPALFLFAACAFLLLCPDAAAQTDGTDICVEEVRLVAKAYGSGAPLRIAAKVVNRGPDSARSVRVATFMSGRKIDEKILPLLESGETRRIVTTLPLPEKKSRLKVVVAALPGYGRGKTEIDLTNNAARIAIEATPLGNGEGEARSVQWLFEPIYIVDAPYRVEPAMQTVPLLVMIVSELPNENGWDPDLDRFNSIRLWINGNHIGKLEDAFAVPDTRFWYKIYDIPISLLGNVDDYNLIRVNLDLKWADDRGPDIQAQNSAWGGIIDPMNGQPLDNASLFADGDYWYCRVFRSSHSLPNVDSGRWFYGDTHYHTVYTDNSAEIGNPVDATADAARAVGLSWICLTDHSNDLDSEEDAENFKDGLPHPPFTRPQPQSTVAKWSDLLDQAAAINIQGDLTVIVGSEVNFAILKNDFPEVPDDIFAHTLVLGLESAAVPIRGEGQDGMGLFSPIGKDAEAGESGNIPANNTSVFEASRAHGDTLAMWELLDHLEASFPGCAVFLAHPYDEFSLNSVSWTFLMQRNPWHEDSGSWIYEPGVAASYHHPLFKGFQVWNGNPGFGNGIGKDDGQLLGGIDKYDMILQNDLPSFDPAKKLFIIGGSDAHGDFSSYTSRGELYDWDIMQKRRSLVYVMGKVRTAVYIEDGTVTSSAVLDALGRGRSMMTNGPMAGFSVELDGVEYISGDHLTVNRSDLPGMKLNFRWATTPEFGPMETVRLKVVGPSSIQTPITLRNLPDRGARTITIPGTLPGYSGWYALRVVAETDPGQALFQEPDVTYPYRCYTNPIWINIIEGN